MYTRAVFGDYISIYDIQRAVDDGATKPIYYESRLARLELNESEKPLIDPEFEEVTESEEVEKKEKLKRKWAALEAIVGAEKRIGLIAEDPVKHFESRLEVMEGKAMIVCMSRRICVDLYTAIVALRPEWGDEEDTRGEMKVVMTGSASDPVEWQQHIRTKDRREKLANRFKDSKDPFKVVIVRDMWLTGFPAMFDALDGQVFGEVMSFPDIEKTLECLDRLEGYHPSDNRSHYIRIEKLVTILNSGRIIPAWVYVYPKNRLQPDFTPIPSGCWRKSSNTKTPI